MTLSVCLLTNDPGAEVVVQDGPRTAFPCTVGPSESTVVPLDLVPPAAPGRYTVEPDVVHEGVRWFGSGARVDLEVGPPDRGRPASCRERRARATARPGPRQGVVGTQDGESFLSTTA